MQPVNSSPYLAKPAFRAALSIALISVALLCLVYWLDPWIWANEQWPFLLMLNAIPLAFPALILVAVSRRLWASAVIMGCLVWMLFSVNQVKLEELNQPVLFTDILLTKQVLTNSDLLGRYGQPGLLATAVALMALLTALAFWREKPKGGWKLSASMAVFAALFAWLITTQSVNQAFAKHGALNTPWSPIASVEQTGLLASLAASAGKDLITLPNSNKQDLATIRQWLEENDAVAPSSVYSDELPNIVIILSESFFDPGVLQDINTCDYIPRWCELKSQGQTGLMKVPTYGGNTTRTEYEVLTGVPYRLLPHGVYPYTTVVRGPHASLPWWFKHLGYKTYAIHPHSRTFWQRHRAYPLLGFDEFISERDMQSHQRSGWYISDRDMTDVVIRTLDSNKDRPSFVFAVSMENHGPWDKPRPNIDQDRLETISAPIGLDENATLAWRQYIYHAQNSLIGLERLRSSLESRKRPALLLFFGDHLPGLSSVYGHVDFRNGQNAPQQPTPYLLLSYGLKTAPEWAATNASELPFLLLDAAGLPLPEIYSELQTVFRNAERNPPSKGVEALQTEILHSDPEQW